MGPGSHHLTAFTKTVVVRYTPAVLLYMSNHRILQTDIMCNRNITNGGFYMGEGVTYMLENSNRDDLLYRQGTGLPSYPRRALADSSAFRPRPKRQQQLIRATLCGSKMEKMREKNIYIYSAFCRQ